tara:strand:- start:397 stop:717 length:321 start_codon:yes stop_codon:yes gene_type:complete
MKHYEKVSETQVFNLSDQDIGRMTAAVMAGKMEHYECEHCGKYAKSYTKLPTDAIDKVNHYRMAGFFTILCPACTAKYDKDHLAFFTTKERDVPQEPKSPWGDQFK